MQLARPELYVSSYISSVSRSLPMGIVPPYGEEGLNKRATKHTQTFISQLS